MMSNRRVGKIIEDLALRYLQKKGYVLLKRNFSTRYGEIDLIFKKGRDLVFVEVKGKKEDSKGLPEDMISKKKLQKIENVANFYLQKTKIAYDGIGFESICVVVDKDGKVKRISHYQNF